MALRAARGLAQREGWPADLLMAVELAITRADPFGPDALASQASRWGAIADELSRLSGERDPADRGRLARLLSIAVTGTGIASPAQAIAEAPGDFAQGVAADLRSGAGAVVETAGYAASIARWALPVGLVVGLVYLARRG